MCVCAQSCLTLCNPIDYSPPGSSVHGIFPARIQEWVAIFILQGLFRTQRSNLCLLHLLHWQADPLPLSHLGRKQPFYNAWKQVCRQLPSYGNFNLVVFLETEVCISNAKVSQAQTLFSASLIYETIQATYVIVHMHIAFVG